MKNFVLMLTVVCCNKQFNHKTLISLQLMFCIDTDDHHPHSITYNDAPVRTRHFEHWF